MTTHIGSTIRAWRARRGWTQYRLAQAAGLSATLVAQIEDGTRARPSFQTLERLTAALGKSLEKLRAPME